MGKVLRCLMAGALVATLGVACGDDDDDDAAADEFAGETSTSTSPEGEEEPLAFEESEADTVLTYSLVDYKFEGAGFEAPAGKVFFKATNNGTEEHELEVLDSTGEAVGEIVAMPPGEDGEFAAELAAGNYKFQCILENAEGKPHTELGMVADFVVK
jgi:hypothetical protein